MSCTSWWIPASVWVEGVRLMKKINFNGFLWIGGILSAVMSLLIVVGFF